MSVSDLQLTFGPNTSTVNTTITLIDDSFVEDRQVFFGNLHNPGGDVTIKLNQTTITIFDDPTDSKL